VSSRLKENLDGAVRYQVINNVYSVRQAAIILVKTHLQYLAMISLAYADLFDRGSLNPAY